MLGSDYRAATLGAAMVGSAGLAAGGAESRDALRRKLSVRTQGPDVIFEDHLI